MKLVEIKDVLAPCDYNHIVELTEKVKELEKDVQTLTNNYKLLEAEQASDIAHGQALVDEFGDFEVFYEELQNLRALLKDCKETIEAQKKFFAPAFECCKGDYNRILTRINAAIGESEE